MKKISRALIRCIYLTCLFATIVRMAAVAPLHDAPEKKENVEILQDDAIKKDITRIPNEVNNKYNSKGGMNDLNNKPSEGIEKRMQDEENEKNIDGINDDAHAKYFETKHGYLRWKHHHIPYIISSKFSKQYRQLIEQTIYHWNKEFRNCIEWNPYVKNKDKDLVYFKKGDMCLSEQGRMAGRQLIMLDEKTCGDRREVLHEMSHTVGLSHEHNRPDREDYIQVLFRNIPFEWRQQFFIDEDSIMADFGYDYDYYSLMHYGQKSPDRQKPAFNVLKDGVNASLIGTGSQFSNIDIKKIKKLYCPKKI